MKLLLALIAALVCCSLSAAPMTVSSYVAAERASTDSPPSWIEGGLGKLAPDGARGEVRLGIDVEPREWLTLHVSALGRNIGGDTRGGLGETWIRATFEPHENLRLRLKAGSFFLPTSRENVEELWVSPYSSTTSTINSWIGEEVRPTAVDGELRFGDSSAWHFFAAATAIRGSDSAGALLAWRGWSLGSGISAWNETLPLPPLESLHGIFAEQRAGTRPVERDLDGRTGWSARVRAVSGDRFLVQWLRFDNRGDRQLHRGEYAWATRFDSVSAESGPFHGVTAAAEWMGGRTGMGPLPNPPAQVDFAAAYALVSWRVSRHQLMIRRDVFETSDRDHAPSGDDNDERGNAWTASWRFDLPHHFRLGAEWTDVHAKRPEALRVRGDERLDGRSILVSLSWSFATQ